MRIIVGACATFDGLCTEGQQVEISLNPVAVLTSPGPDIMVLGMDLDTCGCLTEVRAIAAGSGAPSRSASAELF